MAPLSQCWPSLVRVLLLTVRVLSSTIKVPPPTANILTLAVMVPQSTARVSTLAVKMLLILQHWGQKRLSLWDVLMVEAIDLDVWIFMLAPTMGTNCYDLWSVLRVGVVMRSMVTQETQGFLDRSDPLEDNIPMSCVLVLLMEIVFSVSVVF
jgi:hypothetical protein